jgi:CubicO group peptidase (beta-lactamase class C family)
MASMTLGLICATLLASGLPPGKPEEVGLSSERLGRVREMVLRRVVAGEISGAVTMVARRGRLVHYEANGLMDLESNKPMRKDALFRLASTTKPVTAVAVLMLMEEGKLKLTDPVSRYIPEFRGQQVGPEGAPAAREVTILDLLTHTSGLLSGGPSTEELKRVRESRKETDTLADFIPKLAAIPLDFQPGTKWRYSGMGGFDVLGRIVEIASGVSFDRFLRDRLFEPLGMKSTWFVAPPRESERMARIYRKGPKGLEPGPGLSMSTANYFSGAGGLISTAEDFLQFAQMLCNGGEWNGKRILSPWTVDLMMANQVGDLFLGQIGRPPRGVGFGLGGEVVMDHVEARLRKPDGSYGWDGAFGTYWWVNRKEQMVVVYFVQTPGREQHHEFDNAVAQAVIE